MSARMTMEKYEKPEMKFVALRNEEAVAAPCWAIHGKPTKYYCDIPGEGYVSFQIGAGSCSLNLVNVIYYDDKGNSSEASEAQKDTLFKILEGSGGSDGNPYSGIGTTVLPDPSPEWS